MHWWNDLDAVNRFSTSMQWLTVAFTVLTAAAAALGIISNRRGAALQDVRSEQMRTDLNATSLAAKSSIDELQKLRDERQTAEELRRTAPKVDAHLRVTGNAEFTVEIAAGNLVPFEFEYLIVTKNNAVVSGVMMEHQRVVPAAGKQHFIARPTVQIDRIQGRYLELRFRFRSMAPDLYGQPGHTGQVVRKYNISPHGWALEEVP